MKKLISKFSDKLLSKQQLKTVKGGAQYCFCSGQLVYIGSSFPPGWEGCTAFCQDYGSNPGGGCPSIIPGCPPGP